MFGAEMRLIKGQKISKANFLVLISSKKLMKCQDVLVDFSALMTQLVKFIYSEKATKFCEISTVDLTGTT